MFKLIDPEVMVLIGAMLWMIIAQARYKAKVARRRKWYHEKKQAGKI